MSHLKKRGGWCVLPNRLTPKKGGGACVNVTHVTPKKEQVGKSLCMPPGSPLRLMGLEVVQPEPKWGRALG
jgi:hypothetical protein